MDAGRLAAGALGRALERFGPQLTIDRDGAFVCFRFGMAAAEVILDRGGRLEAIFVDSSAIDARTSAPAESRYRRVPQTFYRLTPEGCERFAADLADFFDGKREPGFAFVGVDLAVQRARPWAEARTRQSLSRGP